MELIWGIVLVIFTLLLCWMGQIITTFSPRIAVKMQLTEAEADVDPAFYADLRGEALWDMLILWTLPVAGILLILDNPIWAYFGLVGGGSFLYFAGRGIAVRLTMQRRGIHIGKPGNLKVPYIFLTIWGLIAAVTIIVAALAL